MSNKWKCDQIDEHFETITDPSIRRYVEGTGESDRIQLRTFYRKGHKVASLCFLSYVFDAEIMNETNVDLLITLKEKPADT